MLISNSVTSVHYPSSQFSYNYSNRLDSMLRRASLTDEYDINTLTVEPDNKGNSDSNPVPVKEPKQENVSRYKAPCMPCNLVTTARVEAMLQRLDVADNDDDQDLLIDITSGNTTNGTPFRRTKSLMYKIKKKVSKTIKRTSSMTTMKL